MTEECWLWKGQTQGGYGRVWKDGRWRWAHRAAYYDAYGSIPRGAVILHACDNPLCVNPAHLSAGTVAENNADRDRKGRHASKISRSDALAIRCRALIGERRDDLAREFRISRDMVNKIVRGERWKSA